MQPPPHIVVERLLRKMKNIVNKAEQTRDERLVQSFDMQTEEPPKKTRPVSPAKMEDLGLPLHSCLNIMIKLFKAQPKSNLIISDWKRVPEYKITMENYTDVQAVKVCIPEFDREKFSYFGRDIDPTSDSD